MTTKPKRFIVSIDTATATQIKSIHENVIAKLAGTGWWHWLNNTWLISDPTNNHTAEAIRDKIYKAVPSINCLVVELRRDGTDTWAGVGPDDVKPDTFSSWLNQNWEY